MKTKYKEFRKFLLKPSTREGAKRGLASTTRFFKEISNGIDDTFGIPKQEQDYTIVNKRVNLGRVVIRKRPQRYRFP